MGCCTALNFARPYVHLMTVNKWTSVYLVVDAVTAMAGTIAEGVVRAMKNTMRTQQTTFVIPAGGRNSETFTMILRELNTSSRGEIK